MGYMLYFWREEREIEPAADSLLERLAEDGNLPGADRLSLAAIEIAFRRHFPDIAIKDHELEWQTCEGAFCVSFSFDELDQPTSICVSSEAPLFLEDSDVFSRIVAVVREIGCTRTESAIA